MPVRVILLIVIAGLLYTGNRFGHQTPAESGGSTSRTNSSLITDLNNQENVADAFSRTTSESDDQTSNTTEQHGYDTVETEETPRTIASNESKNREIGTDLKQKELPETKITDEQEANDAGNIQALNNQSIKKPNEEHTNDMEEENSSANEQQIDGDNSTSVNPTHKINIEENKEDADTTDDKLSTDINTLNESVKADNAGTFGVEKLEHTEKKNNNQRIDDASYQDESLEEPEIKARDTNNVQEDKSVKDQKENEDNPAIADQKTIVDRVQEANTTETEINESTINEYKANSDDANNNIERSANSKLLVGEIDENKQDSAQRSGDMAKEESIAKQNGSSGVERQTKAIKKDENRPQQIARDKTIENVVANDSSGESTTLQAKNGYKDETVSDKVVVHRSLSESNNQIQNDNFVKPVNVALADEMQKSEAYSDPGKNAKSTQITQITQKSDVIDYKNIKDQLAPDEKQLHDHSARVEPISPTEHKIKKNVGAPSLSGGIATSSTRNTPSKRTSPQNLGNTNASGSENKSTQTSIEITEPKQVNANDNANLKKSDPKNIDLHTKKGNVAEKIQFYEDLEKKAKAEQAGYKSRGNGIKSHTNTPGYR